MSVERHNYEYDIDLEGASAPAFVARLVGGNKKVLEIGAGPGSITKVLKYNNNCEVVGLERDETALPKLSQFCKKVFQADLNEPDWDRMLIDETPFDVVVSADVLEHVYEPLAVLKKIKQLMSDSGEVVVSVPHASHLAIIACLLDEDFQYRDWGLLDRTHIRFFGLKNIQELFRSAGLKIIDARFVITPPEESEFAKKWHKLPQGIRNELKNYEKGYIYQVVVKAVSQEYPGHEIELMNLSVDVNDRSKQSFIESSAPKRILRRVLGDKGIKFVRSFIKR